MERLFCNAFESGDVLLEECPAGDEHRELVDLDPEDARVLLALVKLESFRLSRALGALFLAGVREGRKARPRVTG